MDDDFQELTPAEQEKQLLANLDQMDSDTRLAFINTCFKCQAGTGVNRTRTTWLQLQSK
jgi:hypothetical protein